MFRRDDINLPKEPHYPADLATLGYTINQYGQFVKMNTPEDKAPEFFQFFISDSDRANQLNREAFQECNRRAVLASLANLGVKELYVHEDGFVGAKPEGPHLAILATELAALKEKKDVVVVVNEHMQDLGIWAYRALHREGGIDEGSAVGLVKRLQAWVATTAATDSVASVGTIEKVMQKLKEKLKLDGADGEAADGVNESDAPGVIILNPGQLLFSNDLNKSMSQFSWLARPKKSAIDDNVRIDPIYNKVKGHETPEAHVCSVFDHVIPKITRSDVRLYIVGLSEGGDNVVAYLDEKFSSDSHHEMGDKLECVALMQPGHTPSQIKSDRLATFLMARGRSYVLSDKPKGTLLQAPADVIAHYTDGAASQELPPLKERESEGSESSTSSPIAIPSGKGKAIGPGPQGASGSYTNPRSLGSKISSYSLPKSAAAMQQSIISLQSTNGSLEKSQSTLSKSVNGNMEESTDDLDGYRYDRDPVSCATFSSGVEDVMERIWPNVMDDLLQWFKEYSENSEQQEKRMLASIEQRTEGGARGLL